MATDKIKLRDVKLDCIIGTLPHERENPQTIYANIDLHLSLLAASRSDQLDDTVDYSALHSEIAAATAASSFLLLERLAGMIADICLKRPQVSCVRVELAKPAALAAVDVANVLIEITRTRQEDSQQ